MKIGTDAAASEFFTDEGYDLDFKNKEKDKSKLISGEKLAELYKELVKEYPLVFVEDPFDEDDFESFAKLTAGIFVVTTILSGLRL